ncbi:protein RRP6-like 2 isoform X2 [Wolffia australiana]
MADDPASPKEKTKADALLALVKGPLAASAARLSAHSRALPAGKDFHFYRNFPLFASPARQTASTSSALLSSIASSQIVNGSSPASLPDDLDDAHDWVVNLNDEILERFSASMDEFRSLRAGEEQGQPPADRISAMEEGGFQIVQGKKAKKIKNNGDGVDGLGVKVVGKDRKTGGPRSVVPFHIPSIPRPQDSFKILVNNSNQPFEHVWLERSTDGCHFVHPLEKLSVLDFIDGSTHHEEPVMPLPIEDTPFKFVEDVKDLKELAAKLRCVDEFSVDLEHNQYRSFQGLTCLMQISTRSEDFIVDTLKLRVHVGPHLREVFKDPSKRKVMHGADRDILWLQRDFGIYVCNLFDTGQASRVLQLERNSLEFLLQYFCGVTANKEYQQADWRLRPLPSEMVKYAREDTHYLLFMYDVMRRRLLSESPNTDIGDSLLAEVYKRSSEICLQLYEKELLTETSYLRIYGLSEADLNPQQIAVVAGLWEWRDYVARTEDESTGYILPNKALLEIARQMPLTSGLLRRLVKSKHPYVERNLSSVVSVIQNAVNNAANFEPVVDYLKNAHLEAASAAAAGEANSTSTAVTAFTEKESRSTPMQMSAVINGESESTPMMATTTAKSASSPSPPTKMNVVTVQTKEKPVGAFGALFGSSLAKKKFASVSPYQAQGAAAAKLEQIRSSVALPFHSFSGSTVIAPPPAHVNKPPTTTTATAVTDVTNTTEDMIPLDDTAADSSDSRGEGEPPPPAVVSSSVAGGPWRPFNYTEARKEVKFGNHRAASRAADPTTPSNGQQRGVKGNGSMAGAGTGTTDFSAPRRCQAYPASGNRSATFH